MTRIRRPSVPPNPTVAEPSQLTSKRTILVTSALPYANNSLHFGHLVEYVQTDIWVRFQRLRGARCIYVCASDAHGTPTMLRAEQEGFSAEELIARISAEHRRDFATFRISVDNYHYDASDGERELTPSCIGARARPATSPPNHQASLRRRATDVPARPLRARHLPALQHGRPVRRLLRELRLDVLAARPQRRRFRSSPARNPTRASPSICSSGSSAFEDELREWVPSIVDAALRASSRSGFEAGLKDWDISRDPPYFGFRIPGERDKYFYVWFDAPIGYMASFLSLCRRVGSSTSTSSGAPDSRDRALSLHRQGHPVLPLAVLAGDALAARGYRTPTGCSCTAYLTVDGQKMSKTPRHVHSRPQLSLSISIRTTCATTSRRSSIPASTTSTCPSRDFMAKVNADLVGKLVNIASRCAGFVQRSNRAGSRRSSRTRRCIADFADSGRSTRGPTTKGASTRARFARDHGARRSGESIHR